MQQSRISKRRTFSSYYFCPKRALAFHNNNAPKLLTKSLFRFAERIMPPKLHKKFSCHQVSTDALCQLKLRELLHKWLSNCICKALQQAKDFQGHCLSHWSTAAAAACGGFAAERPEGISIDSCGRRRHVAVDRYLLLVPALSSNLCG